jgi:hypothetical protein
MIQRNLLARFVPYRTCTGSTFTRPGTIRPLEVTSRVVGPTVPANDAGGRHANRRRLLGRPAGSRDSSRAGGVRVEIIEALRWIGRVLPTPDLLPVLDGKHVGLREHQLTRLGVLEQGEGNGLIYSHQLTGRLRS